ncbi:MAG: iron-sulfur cluster carrier protein ApbC [Steroidobacteraceae bacterium]
MSTGDEPVLINAVLAATEPLTGLTLAELGASVQCLDTPDGYDLSVRLGFPVERHQHLLEPHLRQHLAESGCRLPGRIQFGWQVEAQGGHRVAPLPGVANVIAVASGKGGVGKSTVAVNLALALVAEGARVGLLDADIYGPSQPLLLGLAGQRPQGGDPGKVLPVSRGGLAMMSIGLLVGEDQPMAWRGPMATQALVQLLGDTQWGELDYLFVDMPPGTGDIQLTLSQRVPLSGAVIVTTPQEMSLLDARRGLQMFRKVEVPVLGVIENMSYHACPACGHREALFGSEGGRRVAERYAAPLLGELPLDARVRAGSDEGQPVVLALPDSELARGYRHAALATVAQLAARHVAQPGAFPKITVGDDE